VASDARGHEQNHCWVDDPISYQRSRCGHTAVEINIQIEALSEVGMVKLTILKTAFENRLAGFLSSRQRQGLDKMESWTVELLVIDSSTLY